MSDWARRQLYVKRKKECKTLPINCPDCSEHPNTCGNIEEEIDSKTGKEEWENEFDREEIYENPFP